MTPPTSQHRTRARVAARVALLIASPVAFGATAAAQAAARDSLPAVVVTATRVPARQVAPTATTTVISGDTLRAQGITHLLDALRQVPGAAVVQGSSFGSQASLFLRGGESDYTLVLIDGVPANDPGGFFDFGTLTTDNIDRIEVVRGPASVLYGSDAIAGVIQVFTRRGTGATTGGALASAGSYGSTRAEVGARGGSPALGWSFAGAHHGTQGILPFNNRYDNRVGSGALRVARGRVDAALTSRYNRSRFEYPTDGAGNIVDRNAERTEVRWQAALDAGIRLTDRVQTRLLLTRNEILPRTNDGPDSRADTLGFYAFYARGRVLRHGADLRTDWRLTQHTVTVGGEYNDDRERSSNRSLSQFGPFPGSLAAARHTRALYAQALGDLGSRVSYTVGARLDDNSAFGTFRTARAGLGLRLASHTRVRASLGTAFKEPSFFENFATGFTVGNPALQPERTRSAEIGVERASPTGRWSGRVTAFRQRFANLIQYTGRPPARSAPNYYNVAAADADGVELELGARLPARLTLAANATLTDTRVIDAGFDSLPNANFVAGQRLLRRPSQLYSVALARPVGARGTVHLTVLRMGSRDDRDFSSFPARPVVLDPFTRVDGGAVLPLPGPLDRADAALLLRVENLLGTAYRQVVGFDAPGRTVTAGVRLGTP